MSANLFSSEFIRDNSAGFARSSSGVFSNPVSGLLRSATGLLKNSSRASSRFNGSASYSLSLAPSLSASGSVSASVSASASAAASGSVDHLEPLSIPASSQPSLPPSAAGSRAASAIPVSRPPSISASVSLSPPGSAASSRPSSISSNPVRRIAKDLLQFQRTNPSDLSIREKKQDGLSAIEAAILRSTRPIELEDNEEITINGVSGIFANKSEVNDWKGSLPISEYEINEDSNPDVITKKSDQALEYIQELAIRYLRPPTPPAPGEIVITQEPNIIVQPAPPLVVRQQPPRPETPEPLVIREAPPEPPGLVGRKVITISGKNVPPPPRKVIIERLAPLPSKPQSVVIERWLPYSEVKRRVIFNKPAERDPVIIKPKNIIVQWEAPQVRIKKEYKYLGVIKANPVEYVKRYGPTLKIAGELPDFVLQIRNPDGIVLAAEYKNKDIYDLEGDIQALKLIDLDKEGLSEYKKLFANSPLPSQSISASAVSFNASSDPIVSSALASGPLASSAVASGSLASSAVASGPLASSAVASGSLASSAVASGPLASSEPVSSSVVASNPISSSVVVESTQNEASSVSGSASASVSAPAEAPASASIFHESEPAQEPTSVHESASPSLNPSPQPVSDDVSASAAQEQQESVSASVSASIPASSVSTTHGSASLSVTEPASSAYSDIYSSDTAANTTSADLLPESSSVYSRPPSSSFDSRPQTTNSYESPVLASTSTQTSADHVASESEQPADSNPIISNLNSIIERIFKSIDNENTGKISVSDAEKILLRLNSRLGRRYGEDDVKAFFNVLDTNHDNHLDFEEFKHAFVNLTL